MDSAAVSSHSYIDKEMAKSLAIPTIPLAGIRDQLYEPIFHYDISIGKDSSPLKSIDKKSFYDIVFKYKSSKPHRGSINMDKNISSYVKAAESKMASLGAKALQPKDPSYEPIVKSDLDRLMNHRDVILDNISIVSRLNQPSSKGSSRPEDLKGSYKLDFIPPGPVLDWIRSEFDNTMIPLIGLNGLKTGESVSLSDLVGGKRSLLYNGFMSRMTLHKLFELVITVGNKRYDKARKATPGGSILSSTDNMIQYLANPYRPSLFYSDKDGEVQINDPETNPAPSFFRAVQDKRSAKGKGKNGPNAKKSFLVNEFEHFKLTVIRSLAFPSKANRDKWPDSVKYLNEVTDYNASNEKVLIKNRLVWEYNIINAASKAQYAETLLAYGQMFEDGVDRKKIPITKSKYNTDFKKVDKAIRDFNDLRGSGPGTANLPAFPTEVNYAPMINRDTVKDQEELFARSLPLTSANLNNGATRQTTLDRAIDQYNADGMIILSDQPRMSPRVSSRTSPRQLSPRRAPAQRRSS